MKLDGVTVVDAQHKALLLVVDDASKHTNPRNKAIVLRIRVYAGG